MGCIPISIAALWRGLKKAPIKAVLWLPSPRVA